MLPYAFTTLVSLRVKAQWSRYWIPNPVFCPSEVDKMSTRNFWDLVVKSKLPSRSGVSLELVKPKKRGGGEHKISFFFFLATCSQVTIHLVFTVTAAVAT